MDKAQLTSQIKEKYNTISDILNERSRRIWAASEARAIGRGGQILVARATNIHKNTILSGMREIERKKDSAVVNRVRKKGGGRKESIQKDKNLKSDICKLVESSTRGDPESPLLWCSKSTRKIADELNKEIKRISHTTVSSELIKIGYSLQSNKKIKEGSSHPDRDGQFQFINTKTKSFQQRHQPVISVDTKKKENIGNFKNNGKEYCHKGKPTEVNTYDFIDKTKGKVSPYGIYDIEQNNGWVSVGISGDTAEFAVNSIYHWWDNMGKLIYPNATEIYINADGGGSNGCRVRLWKTELQKLATKIEMNIHVSHFPPGTSKWNKIEHKMFSFISKNWRGKPLIDRATVVNLIGNTTTKTGLKVRAILDEKVYQKGIKISDSELLKVNLETEAFHGEWNYKIMAYKS